MSDVHTPPDVAAGMEHSLAELSAAMAKSWVPGDAAPNLPGYAAAMVSAVHGGWQWAADRKGLSARLLELAADHPNSAYRSFVFGFRLWSSAQNSLSKRQDAEFRRRLGLGGEL